jgi:hypothetical protein
MRHGIKFNINGILRPGFVQPWLQNILYEIIYTVIFYVFWYIDNPVLHNRQLFIFLLIKLIITQNFAAQMFTFAPSTPPRLP